MSFLLKREMVWLLLLNKFPINILCFTSHTTRDQAQDISNGWNPPVGLSLWIKWEYSLLAEALQIGTFLLDLGTYPTLVLFRLCHVSLSQQFEGIRLSFFLRRPKLCGWKITLLPRGCCYIMGITVLLKPQTGFPSFCSHNFVWLQLFSLALYPTFFIKQILFCNCPLKAITSA